MLFIKQSTINRKTQYRLRLFFPTLIFEDIPEEEREHRDGKTDCTECIFSRPFGKMRQLPGERLRMEPGIPGNVYPSSQAEDKECEEERAENFHVFLL